MKKFILKLSIFIGLLIIADITLGGVFKLYDFAKGGELGKIHRIMTQESPELVILGSSRACHHYVPSIMRDSVGLKAYNAGLDGQGCVMGYAFFHGIGSRKYPKVLICEITPSFDIFEGHSPTLNNLYPYIDNPKIYALISDFDANSKLKLISNGYRLNSALLRLIPSFFKKIESIEGYEPSFGTLIITEISNTSRTTGISEIDSIKEKYFRVLIEDAREYGCKLVFTISPQYGGADISPYEFEISILNEYGIPVLNHLNDKEFINNASLFNDPVHLNDTGARKYTKVIIGELKKLKLNN